MATKRVFATDVKKIDSKLCINAKSGEVDVADVVRRTDKAS